MVLVRNQVLAAGTLLLEGAHRGWELLAHLLVGRKMSCPDPIKGSSPTPNLSLFSLVQNHCCFCFILLGFSFVLFCFFFFQQSSNATVEVELEPHPAALALRGEVILFVLVFETVLAM